MKATKTPSLKRLRHTANAALASWATAWVTLHLLTVPGQRLEVLQRRGSTRGLSRERKEEHRSLVKFWKEFDALPLKDRADYYIECDELELDFAMLDGGAGVLNDAVEDMKLEIEAALETIARGN